MTDKETLLRELWDTMGVSKFEQDRVIDSITAKARPGAMVGPFKIPEAHHYELCTCKGRDGPWTAVDRYDEWEPAAKHAEYLNFVMGYPAIVRPVATIS
jgi:hypothetical protein